MVDDSLSNIAKSDDKRAASNSPDNGYWQAPASKSRAAFSVVPAHEADKRASERPIETAAGGVKKEGTPNDFERNPLKVDAAVVSTDVPAVGSVPTLVDSKMVDGETMLNPVLLPSAMPGLKDSSMVDRGEKDKKGGKNSPKDKVKRKRQKKSKNHTFQVEHNLGVQAGPALAIRQLYSPGKVSNPDGHLEGRKQTERMLESYTVGIFYSAAIPNGLLLKTGLDYRQSNEKFHLGYFTKETAQINGLLTVTVDNAGNTIDQTSGAKTITKTTEYSNTAFNHYRYVNFPVGLGYRHTAKKSRWDVSGGVDFNMFFRAKATVFNVNNVPTAVKSGTSTYASMFRRRTGMGLWGSLAYDWKLTDRLRWRLSADAQIPLGRVSSMDYKLVQRYFNFGVQAGVFYQIKQEWKWKKVK